MEELLGDPAPVETDKSEDRHGWGDGCEMGGELRGLFFPPIIRLMAECGSSKESGFFWCALVEAVYQIFYFPTMKAL